MRAGDLPPPLPPPGHTPQGYPQGYPPPYGIAPRANDRASGEIIGWIEVALILLAVVVIAGLILMGNQTRNVSSNISAGLVRPLRW